MKGIDRGKVVDKINSIQVSIETIVLNLYILEAIFRLNDMPDWVKHMQWLESGIIEFKKVFDKHVQELEEQEVI